MTDTVVLYHFANALTSAEVTEQVPVNTNISFRHHTSHHSIVCAMSRHYSICASYKGTDRVYF